jgi:hypothetical protein
MIDLLGPSMIKIISFGILVYLVNQWSHGNYDKKIRSLKRIKRRYSSTTLILLVIWWVLTPSGTPDDVITLAIIDYLGFTLYMVLVSMLTIYVIWRMNVTIIITGNKK